MIAYQDKVILIVSRETVGSNPGSRDKNEAWKALAHLSDPLSDPCCRDDFIQPPLILPPMIAAFSSHTLSHWQPGLVIGKYPLPREPTEGSLGSTIASSYKDGVSTGRIIGLSKPECLNS